MPAKIQENLDKDALIFKKQAEVKQACQNSVDLKKTIAEAQTHGTKLKTVLEKGFAELDSIITANMKDLGIENYGEVKSNLNQVSDRK